MCRIACMNLLICEACRVRNLTSDKPCRSIEIGGWCFFTEKLMRLTKAVSDSHTASATPEKVIALSARHVSHDRTPSVLNPATRALKVRTNADLKIERALKRELRRIQFRLVRSLLRLYLAKLVLDCRSAGLRTRRYLSSGFDYTLFRSRWHNLPPTVPGSLLKPKLASNTIRDNKAAQDRRCD
jgi:hypothetical protein